jgi:peptidoglycan biosynthesis protein MviN/MurJ (putative lipid II flippase)
MSDMIIGVLIGIIAQMLFIAVMVVYLELTVKGNWLDDE